MEPDLSGAAELDDTHQMISLEDMELAEKMITSMQIYHVPLQLKLVSPPGEQLKLNSDNFWTLYLCLDGSIQIDDSRITVRSSSTVEKVMLPPGHYNVELVGGDDNNNFTYEYYYFNMECKLKNIINIKKSTNYKKFLKRLGITAYNYDTSNNYLDFVCGKTHFTDETYDTDIVWSMYLNKKKQILPDTIVSFDPNDDWKPYF